jgi:hypothetical protein
MLVAALSDEGRLFFVSKSIHSPQSMNHLPRACIIAVIIILKLGTVQKQSKSEAFPVVFRNPL